MKKTLILVVSAILSIGLIGCDSTPKQEQKKVENKEVLMDAIIGTIAYRERIALPPNAVVTVTLEDISLMDVAAKKVAEQTFTTDGDQVPFDFELSFDANQIKEKHRYGIRAMIRVDGKLRFTTDTTNEVITDSSQTREIALRLISVP